ncbi:hypothetical protein NDU88_007329 [Pleurodeles waltl]|uniref:Uncharacterized protein n=1 Tax=Pleurodeles waltl TaxID=8319 RepID=A0AAV7RRJ9_PLEWA|nr:hypothetical protein NDU88_007329 [Pleurodeles waltl]
MRPCRFNQCSNSVGSYLQPKRPPRSAVERSTVPLCHLPHSLDCPAGHQKPEESVDVFYTRLHPFTRADQHLHAAERGR